MTRAEFIERLKKLIEEAENDERTAESVQNVPNDDLISQKAAIDKFIDGLEEIFADLRERHGDDSVCGLCEYDGAYLGQSGDWCNECPGFEKDDCFKLSGKIRKKWADEIIKAVLAAQPEQKKGEWEEIEVIPEAYDIAGVKTWASKMRCNQCGFTTFAIEGRFAQYNFCPNCGSYNGGEQE